MEKRRVVIAAFNDVQSLDVVGPAEVFATAGGYEVQVVAPEREPFAMSNGMRVVPAFAMDEVRGQIDTLVIAGGTGTRDAINDERIVGSSSIYCVGSTIMVNGTLMSPPFKVLVIGPQNELLATYDDPTQLRDIKQRRDIYGLGFRVSRATGLRLAPYRGALNVRFATPR